MDSAVHIKNGVLAVLAAIGSAIANALGGWDVPLQVLLGFMAVDYVTGVIVAGVFHRSSKTETGSLQSWAGFKGLVRKCGTLVLVFMGVLLDRILGQDFVRTAVCLFFIANEGLSILENLGLMGLPYPKFIREMLEVLRKKSDSRDEDDAGKGA